MQPFDLGIAIMIGCQSLASGMRSSALMSSRPPQPVYDEETPDKLVKAIKKMTREWDAEWDTEEGTKCLNKMNKCLGSLIGKISNYDFDRILSEIRKYSETIYKVPIGSSDKDNHLA